MEMSLVLMPRLTNVSGGFSGGTEYDFERSVVVGRGSMADLSLDHPSVSHRHAMLRWVDNECWVVDLESRNGTSVNNRASLGTDATAGP
jgi:pSer/pThr/pTyr-binding forkhead associated (FHA) protein